MRNGIIFKTDSPHLKLIGDLYDKAHIPSVPCSSSYPIYLFVSLSLPLIFYLSFDHCSSRPQCHDTMVQYAEFLATHVPKTDPSHPGTSLVDMLPSFLELTQQYHLDPDAAFTLLRPVLSLKYVRSLLLCADTRQLPAVLLTGP
jgi:hypothetical protein